MAPIALLGETRAPGARLFAAVREPPAAAAPATGAGVQRRTWRSYRSPWSGAGSTPVILRDRGRSAMPDAPSAPAARWRWPKHDGDDPPARISEQKHAVAG